jgi:hypothetical protein
MSTIEKLKQINAAREELEIVLGDFIGGIAGYAVAFIPSYWSAHHMISVLRVPTSVGVIFGVLFALLEFSILSRFIQLYQYRVSGKAQKGSVSPWIPGSMFGFYLLVILLINGVLAFFDSIGANYNDDLSVAMVELVRQWGNNEYLASVFVPAVVQTAVIFLSSLFSIPAAVTVTSGLQQRKFIEDHKSKLAERKEPTQPKQPTQKPERAFKLTQKHKKFLKAIEADKNILNNKTALETVLGVSRPTINKYEGELLERGYYKKTPNGLVFDVKYEV